MFLPGRTKEKLIVFALITFILFVITSTATTALNKQIDKQWKNGDHLSAQILNRENNETRRSDKYHLKIRYKHQSKTYEYRLETNYDTYQRSRVGDTLEISLDPKNPLKPPTIKNSEPKSASMWLIGPTFLFLLLTVVCFFKLRSEKRDKKITERLHERSHYTFSFGNLEQAKADAISNLENLRKSLSVKYVASVIGVAFTASVVAYYKFNVRSIPNSLMNLVLIFGSVSVLPFLMFPSYLLASRRALRFIQGSSIEMKRVVALNFERIGKLKNLPDFVIIEHGAEDLSLPDDDKLMGFEVRSVLPMTFIKTVEIDGDDETFVFSNSPIQSKYFYVYSPKWDTVFEVHNRLSKIRLDSSVSYLNV